VSKSKSDVIEVGDEPVSVNETEPEQGVVVNEPEVTIAMEEATVKNSDVEVCLYLFCYLAFFVFTPIFNN
jgi:hypothetical protein